MTGTEPSLEEFEGRGFFLHIPFEEEDSPTVLYVAHKDFESLQGLIENPDASWEEFREEIFSLLEHSGHEGDHELSQSTTQQLMELVQNQELPEEPEIDNPLEDVDTDTSELSE
ncbi:MAG: hypothetical protein ABEK50_17780 [bacterium]